MYTNPVNDSFDKEILTEDPTLEWVTPGHPLFESVRSLVKDTTSDDLQRGAVFFDLQRANPALLDVFAAEIRDGLGNTLHKRLFVMESMPDGTIAVRQPTIFLDLSVSPTGTSIPDGQQPPSRSDVEAALYENALQPLLTQTGG